MPDVAALQECDMPSDLMTLLEPFGYTTGRITDPRDYGINSRDEPEKVMAHMNDTQTTHFYKTRPAAPGLIAKGRCSKPVTTLGDGVLVIWNTHRVRLTGPVKYFPLGDGVSKCTATTGAVPFVDLSSGTHFLVFPGHLPSGSVKTSDLSSEIYFLDFPSHLPSSLVKTSDLIKRWASVVEFLTIIREFRAAGHNCIALIDGNSYVDEEDTVDFDTGDVLSHSLFRAVLEAGLLTNWSEKIKESWMGAADPTVDEIVAVLAANFLSTFKERGGLSGQPSKIGELCKGVIDYVIVGCDGACTIVTVSEHRSRGIGMMPSNLEPSDHREVVVRVKFQYRCATEALTHRALAASASSSTGPVPVLSKAANADEVS